MKLGKSKLVLLCSTLIVSFLSGCSKLGPGENNNNNNNQKPQKHWTHYAQALPGEIPGEENGVREFYVDDDGKYQFSAPSGGTIDYSTDVDFTSFSSNDPRYIFPIKENDNEFSTVLVDLSDNNKVYKDEVPELKKYVAIDAFSKLAGTKKNVLYKHETDPVIHPYYYAPTITCTKVFNNWDELKTTFGGSVAYKPDFKDLASNVYVDGYYALSKDFEITEDVSFLGAECLDEGQSKLDRGFRGTFDGRGHVLTEKEKSLAGGLFGSVLGGTVKNLTINEIKLESEHLGALASQAHNGIFENLTLNYSSIQKTNNGAGPVISKYTTNSTFKNVVVNAQSSTIESVFGGFFGSNTIENFVVNAGNLEKWGTTDSNSKEIAKPTGAISNVSSQTVVLDLPIQELIIQSSAVQSLNLGQDLQDISTCDSINLKISDQTYSLGNNVKSIVIPDSLKSSDLFGNASVEVKKGFITYVFNVFVLTKVVKNLSDLEALAAYDSNTKPIKGYFVLDSNLNLGSFSKATSRIWDFSNGFMGTLDGRNHKITLDLKNSKNGLFGVMKDATLKNITIETTDYDGSGCLLAYYMSGCVISNVTLIISNSVLSTPNKAKYAISNGGSLNNKFSDFKFVASCNIDSLFFNYYGNDEYSNSTIIVPSLSMFADNLESTSLKDVPTGCSLVKTISYNEKVAVEKSSSTFTIPVTIDGTIKGVFYNSTSLGTSLTLNTSIFSEDYGEGGEITILYSKNDIIYRCIVPIIVVTKALNSVSDIKSFLDVADLEEGTTGDGYYGGYFILGKDIVWDNSNYDKNMPEIEMNVNQVGKGFIGTIDGCGHTISNFKTNDPAQRCGFVPRLGKGGVIKNIGFVDVASTNCTIVAAWGEGLVENIFVSYKEGYSHGATNAIVNLYSTPYCKIQIKDSLVDARNDSDGSRRALGNAYKTDELLINNVFVLTKTKTAPVVEYDGTAQETKFGSPDGRVFPLSYDTFSSFQSYSELLAYGGDEINTWNYFSYSNNTLKFGDKVLSTSASDSLPSTHRFIDDYTIVYDKNNLDSIKAAYLIELELFKATADSITFAEVNGQEYSNISISGGKHIRKIAYQKYSNNSNFIVVGNNKVAQEANVAVENNHIVSKGNSIFILSKNNYDMLASGYEFLKEVIGYSVLGQDYILFDNVPSTIPSIDIEFTVAAPYRLLTNKITNYFYEQMAINLAFSGYLFDAAPFLNGDPSTNQAEPIHNDLDWLPPAKYKTAHPDWYRSWNNLDVCWTAHGNVAEYEALVSTLAQNMYEVLMANPTAVRLSFGMEDINYTHCECDACCAVESQNGSYAYQGIKLLNDVTERIEDMPGMEGREFYVYLLGYYFAAKAPENIAIGEHVGFTFAPIRYDYGKPTNSSKSDGSSPIKPEQAKNIHDPNSTANKFVYDNFVKWQNLFKNKFTGKNEMGCWVYNTYFNNYMSFMDSYEANISVCEMIAHEGQGNLRFVYIQGQGKVVNGTGFEAFKQFVNHRALIEAGNKVKNFKDCSTYEEYENSCHDYLVELENEFFGISSRKENLKYVPGTSNNYNTDIAPYRADCNFSNKGYFGYAKTNSSMYALYLAERNEYARSLKEGRIIANVGERLKLTTSAFTGLTSSSELDFVNYLSSGTGTLKKYYSYKQVNISAIKTMLNCYFEALNNVQESTGELKNLCVRHVKFEGLCPLFFATMANTTNSTYGFGNGYSYNSTNYTFANLRAMFKENCNSLGISAVCEGGSMNTFYTKFGY